MYRYIFFDLDGTLIDSKKGVFDSICYALEMLHEPRPKEENIFKYIGLPLQDVFEQYCGLKKEKTQLGIQLYRERYASVGQFEDKAAPGLVDLCQRLAEKGYILAIASSKTENMCKLICERLGYAPFMKTIVGSRDGAGEKKADVIRKALHQLGLKEDKTTDVLMVGDRKFDVLGAKECGIDCVGVEFFGYADEGELKNAGAVAVVKTAEQLGEFILSH